ncbi:repulsive guidance molecule A isoform X2 [Patella vulgata]|uniref:Repulsive guidance molecule A n=1 Tax=Patella caerulea TaxID=87958 RepID=A0AAN8JNF5_PATCE|nr:repulsive guidance molecule A isoform X2 [Patella vulgata]
MAYGTLFIHRAQCDRQAEAAKALPSQTEWKGMGTRRFPSPTVYPVLTLVLLLTLGIALTTAQGLSDRILGCDIDTCAKQFQRLQSVENGVMGPDKECITLRTYWNCIKKKVRDCKGDLNYLTVRTGVKNRMGQNNCSKNGRTLGPEDEKTSVPTIPSVCSYHGKKVYKHCGLFGDPHLSTFHGDFQTCKVQGAWPLVKNKFLLVQVTNDPVTGESSATATSKLTVVIKKNQDCAIEPYLMYQAQTDALPGAFHDGHTHYGPHKAVELLEIEEGKHVEIHIRYIATTIVVRQIGRYFTFAIKMPEEIVNSTKGDSNSGLCDRGCPAHERINYQEYLATRHKKIDNLKEDSAIKVQMPRSDAEGICREAKVVDFYFDSCVFDLMTTGDKNFTLAALSALQDIIKLDPSIVNSQLNRTDFRKYDKTFGNGAPPRTGLSWILAFTVLLCVLSCRKVH